jgi:hypothetical protein
MRSVERGWLRPKRRGYALAKSLSQQESGWKLAMDAVFGRSVAVLFLPRSDLAHRF